MWKILSLESSYIINYILWKWKYLANIMDDSVIICDEVIESYEEDADVNSYDETNFNLKNTTYKAQNFYILLEFLLITIALLIAANIYCYFIIYRGK